jgi:hypothetical protein
VFGNKLCRDCAELSDETRGSRALDRSGQLGQLLPEREILERDSTVSPAKQSDQSKEYDQRCQAFAILCIQPRNQAAEPAIR